MSEQLVKTEFQLMLQKFNRLVENMPSISQVKEDLQKLSDFARNSASLNLRQKEAIMDRVKFYLSGEYGKNAKKDNYKPQS